MIISSLISRSIIRTSIKMTMKCVKENAESSLEKILRLKKQLEEITIIYNEIRTEQLRRENIELKRSLKLAKKALIMVETQNGKTQVPLPNSNEETETETTDTNENKPMEGESSGSIPKPKEGKPKATKTKDQKEKAKVPTAPEPEINIGRLDLRVAKVVDVQRHPDADSLYLLKINCGEEKLRTVCSGLVKYVPMEDLKEKSVMLLCNLKPVKMRGITSEAMVMCASTPDKVEVLSPPAGCEPGEQVHCEGYTRQPDAVMNPKKKIFETVAPDLHTNDSLQACYKGVALSVPGKGNVVAQTLKNVSVK